MTNNRFVADYEKVSVHDTKTDKYYPLSSNKTVDYMTWVANGNGNPLFTIVTVAIIQDNGVALEDVPPVSNNGDLTDEYYDYMLANGHIQQEYLNEQRAGGDSESPYPLAS